METTWERVEFDAIEVHDCKGLSVGLQGTRLAYLGQSSETNRHSSPL